MNPNEIRQQTDGIEITTPFGKVKLHIWDNSITVSIPQDSVVVNRVPVHGSIYTAKVEGVYKIKNYYESVYLNKTIDWRYTTYKRGVDEVPHKSRVKLVDAILASVNSWIAERPELEALASLGKRQQEHAELTKKAADLRQQLADTEKQMWQALNSVSMAERYYNDIKPQGVQNG